MSRLSFTSRNAKATTSYVTDRTATKARHIDRRSVPCPDCGVGVGEQCVTPAGSRTLHVSRKRLTTRLHNEQMAGAWDLLVEINKVTHKERRAIVRRRGITYRALAVELVIDYNTMVGWFHDRQPPATDAGARFAGWILSNRVAS